MALTIPAPKNRLLMPLFILLVLVLAPFALIFSLVRIPFAKRRIVALNEVIASAWIPRGKYVYLNYDNDFPLADFVERQLFPKYGSHIIFDKWSETGSEWTENEADTYHRVTAIMQDIAGDFDGESHLLVGILTPQNPRLASDTKNIMHFYASKDGGVNLHERDIPLEQAEKQIINEIESSLQKWS